MRTLTTIIITASVALTASAADLSGRIQEISEEASKARGEAREIASLLKVKSPDLAKVSEHEREMLEKGANVQGEGQIEP